ncbi:BNR-4 repeat-containing protein [Kitasatospora sp. NPDC057015]|uniref:BNR-4 repeat-containing protein n=1 Tax=Kitasatospora sp. NPDC057015 TaxID=3346001 RepID=UPI0036434A64
MSRTGIPGAPLRRRTVLVAAALTLAAGAVALPPAAAPTAAAATASTPSFDVLSTDATFQCRRSFGGGLYDAASNKTYITYNGPKMDVYVRAYDHATAAWETPVLVKAQNQTGQFDYHNYSTIVLLPNGRLAVFFNKHSVASYMAVAPTAHSADGTWTTTKISGDFNDYPMPVVVGEKLYFFYSRNDDVNYPYRSYKVMSSDDNGTTWSAPSTIIDTGKTPDRFDEVYAFGVAPINGRIYISYTLWGGPQGHARQGKNLYVSVYDPATGRMSNAAGQDAGNTVNSADLSAHLVRAASPASSGDFYSTHPIQYSQVWATDAGQIYVGFGEAVNGQRNVRYGRLNGSTWEIGTVKSGTAQFFDMVKTGTDDFEFLFANEDFTTLSSVVLRDGATLAPVFDLPVDKAGTDADRIDHADYIENRNSISVMGTMVNYANQTDDYSGKWPVFTVKR